AAIHAAAPPRRRAEAAAPLCRIRQRAARAVRRHRGAAETAGTEVRPHGAGWPEIHRRHARGDVGRAAGQGARLDLAAQAMSAALLAVTDAARQAEHMLRDTNTFQWSTVALLGLAVYVYAAEIERRRF